MTSPDSPSPPRWKPLDPHPRRVLGVLIEKAKTTPAGYPMTVNAIVVGCNQKNNRDPLMTLHADEVEQILGELQALGAVAEVDWMGRVNKYRHQGYEWLGVGRTEIAVMTELLLRGEQTLGELRGRAARMEPIADLAALKPDVDALLQRGLMIELAPPGRGQIVSHNLYTGSELAELRARHAGHVPRAGASDDVGSTPRPAQPSASGGGNAAPPSARVAADDFLVTERLTELSAAVAEVRAEIASLRDRVADLTKRVESRG